MALKPSSAAGVRCIDGRMMVIDDEPAIRLLTKIAIRSAMWRCSKIFKVLQECYILSDL